MSQIVIEVEHLSKQYRLGTIGTGTLVHDINRWWHRVLDKPDPYLKISETNDRSKKGSSEYIWSLQDVSLSVERGQVVGIIGRNGAGKSTLLKILSRTTSPTKGSVKIRGRVASLLEVGTGFHPELTGRENIFLNGAILGMTKKEIKAKFDEIVDFSGVERYIDTPVKRYSSGMYVRLAFAVAAYLESEILIVDEVLAVGDAEFQKKCLGKMSEVSKGQGRTVLFVSHNLAAIESLCSKAILLNLGRLQISGTTKAAIHEYLNEPVELKTSYGKYDVRIINVSMNGGAPIKVKDKLHLLLEIECKRKITKPHIQLTITSNHQTLADTATLLTGYQPDYFNEGKNTISCLFHPIILLPERSYFVRLAMRDGDGRSPIIESQEIFKFEVGSTDNKLITSNPHIDQIYDMPIPLTPYEITYNDSISYSWDQNSGR